MKSFLKQMVVSLCFDKRMLNEINVLLECHDPQHNQIQPTHCFGVNLKNTRKCLKTDFPVALQKLFDLAAKNHFSLKDLI